MTTLGTTCRNCGQASQLHGTSGTCPTFYVPGQKPQEQTMWEPAEPASPEPPVERCRCGKIAGHLTRHDLPAPLFTDAVNKPETVNMVCDHIGSVTHPRNPDGPPYCTRCHESATPAVWTALRMAQDSNRRA
jgi:hypothetical protein